MRNVAALAWRAVRGLTLGLISLCVALAIPALCILALAMILLR